MLPVLMLSRSHESHEREALTKTKNQVMIEDKKISWDISPRIGEQDGE